MNDDYKVAEEAARKAVAFLESRQKSDGYTMAIPARVTRNKEVTAAARRQLDFLVSTQAPEGSWKSFPGLKLYGDGTLLRMAGQIDIPGEFLVWINEAVQEIDW